MKCEAIDVAAIDEVLVLDLPAPAGVHRLREWCRADRFVGARPAADDRAVAEERVGVIAERLAERASEQFGAKAGSIDEQIGGDFLARRRGAAR